MRSEGNGEEMEGEANVSSKKKKGAPVMNHESHLRRIVDGDLKSVTERDAHVIAHDEV
jgi:hypothetical protein